MIFEIYILVNVPMITENPIAYAKSRNNCPPNIAKPIIANNVETLVSIVRRNISFTDKSIKSDISTLYQLNTQQDNMLQTQSNSISSLKTTTETLSATTTNLNTLLATCIQHIYFNNGTGHLDDTVSQYTIDKPGIYIFTIVSGSSLISIYKDRYYTS